MIFDPNVSVHLQDTKMAFPYCTLYICLHNLTTEYHTDLKLRKEDHLLIIYGTSSSLLLLLSSLDFTHVRMTVKTIRWALQIHNLVVGYLKLIIREGGSEYLIKIVFFLLGGLYSLLKQVRALGENACIVQNVLVQNCTWRKLSLFKDTWGEEQLVELTCQSTQSVVCGDTCLKHSCIILHVQYDFCKDSWCSHRRRW